MIQLISILPLLLATPGLGLRPAPQAAPVQLGSAPLRSDDSKTKGERCEVAQVIDGDTVHVMRGGKLEKLRLLSVDTEEKIAPGMTSSPTKPQTVFGQETALWARELFAALAEADGRTRVGLVFPEGREQRDIYGRLLCHLLLPDGTDFNLLLVREGKSPYFDKYGRDLICHEAFVAAQAEAREKQVGIWNPHTNEPAEAGAPSAKRPYDRLIPWWNARALAIEDFRRRSAEQPELVIATEDAAAMEKAATGEEKEIEIFGEVFNVVQETDRSLTVLFRGTDRDHPLRVSIADERRPAYAALDLFNMNQEGRQNYIYVRGAVRRSERGFELACKGPEAWRRAGPEPSIPPADAQHE